MKKLTFLSSIKIAAAFAILATSLSATRFFANAGQPETGTQKTIDFNRDIRPILSDNCFQCHGPDKEQRKADLRLDLAEEALADRGGYHVLVPGKLNKSELWHRITSKVKGEKMPPHKSGKKLTEHQIALFRAWIQQGAEYQKHWAFIPPQRPALPKVKHKTWPRNPIDYFVLARLEQEGLSPSPEADKRTLIRRVTLDLTGLPPTIDEVNAFLADTSADAYEKVVKRLLNSPRYGEHMALPWLDAARYADSNGYQADGERHMWRWRDWVIEAFNKNMPFDQFTVEQLAGDLLPNPTLDQLIATGFNRNHRGNAEGGIIPEEYLVEYAVDRVDTTATVWLGLTAGCGRCHDHKYDPISQKEFYQLLAYFNNIPEKGKVVRFGNSPPFIKAPTRPQQAMMKKLQAEIDATERRCEVLEPELRNAQQHWERRAVNGPPIDWIYSKGLLAYFPLDNDSTDKTGKAKAGKFQEGSPTFVDGQMGKAAAFDGGRYLNLGDVGDFGFYDKLSLGAWIYPTNEKGGAILCRMQDNDRSEGYSLTLENGHVHLHLVKRWLDDSMRVQTKTKLQPQQWYHVMATYDGSRTAKGVAIYVNGAKQPLKINLDDLNQNFRTDEPLKVGSGAGADKRFHGYIDDVRAYERCLSQDEVRVVSVPESISEILALAHGKRSPAQAAKLRTYFLLEHAPERIQQAHQKLAELRQEWVEFSESLPTVMIMKERKTPKDTYVLKRGEYDKPGEKVQRGVPDAFPPLPKGVPNNRLGFAKWLVHPSNPLTARVAVNRFWQRYFGAGLVQSSEDFGSQGEWPSHPLLLDWLATEFIRTGWNIKEMQKLIVTSATYRQASKVSPLSLEKDPENRLLARGPRVRLSAHTIRDQALFVSGLLVEKLGGPSVKPYQPKGLWRELGGSKYVADKGKKLYRRSLYMFWKRTIPPPSMMTFDAAGRESCIVRPAATNTPLQALNLLNDVAYVEAARKMAERIMLEGGKTSAKRLSYAFQLALSRPPNSVERKILQRSLEKYRRRYSQDRQAAMKLLSIGESARNPDLDVTELAAFTATCSVILNLDETITKQ